MNSRTLKSAEPMWNSIGNRWFLASYLRRLLWVDLTHFGAPSVNGRYLRKGDISDRGGGRRSWAASSHRSKDGPRKRKSIGSPQWRCNLFIEFAVPPWLDADEH